jgi:putative cardiolipin synthase
VIVAGQAAADIGADFDRYWASRSAHPAERILAEPDDGALDRLVADARAAAASPEGRLYAERLQRSNVVSKIFSGTVAFEWTRVTLVSDDPAKGLGEAADDDLLFPQLMALLARPGRSVDLVSAYFVPGRRFTTALADLARGGTRVRILTNSQDATDVIVVHSAYVKYRPELLRSGVELYELKPAFSTEAEPGRLDPSAPSRASLHSKTMAVDEERIFIGSFNFDPRSLHLNTEMGVLIESPRMAAGLAHAFVQDFPKASYRPRLTERGTLVWEEIAADGTRILHANEPGSGPISRLLLRFLGLLPIEWLL